MAETALSDGYNVTSVQHFLGWWKSHLWQSVPTALRDRARKSLRPAMVSVADGLVWPARQEIAKPLPLGGSALMSGNGSNSVALVIGERNGFRREVALPLTVEDRLDQVLAYELDRLTPLRPDDLYYDFRLIRRDNSKGLCIVQVLAAPKVRVNAVITSLREKGIIVDRLLLSANDVDEGVDLMRNARKSNESIEKRGWLTPALLFLCAALIMALIAYPIFKKRQYVIALLPVESAARAEAETATVLQRQLEKQVGDYNLLLRRKHAAPIAVQVLEDLSKRLPDDTWAQTFEIKPLPNSKNHEVILQGETGSGAKLLQLVQESPLLKDPALKAAMTRVAPNAERFHISGELTAVAPPGGLALADGNTLMSNPMQITPGSAAGSPNSVSTLAKESPSADMGKAPAMESAKSAAGIVMPSTNAGDLPVATPGTNGGPPQTITGDRKKAPDVVSRPGTGIAPASEKKQ
jgi:general secretion pathway protein L